MKSKRMLKVILSMLSVTVFLSRGQTPAPPPRTGPGVQAPQDAREPEVLATCKTPPPPRGGGAGRGPGNAAAGPRDYMVPEIPGVIAAGERWKQIWTVEGNNGDGIIGTKDGGVMVARNDKSDVLKLDRDGKTSVVYTDTNTGGALSMSSKGVLFLNSRGLHEAVLELTPKRRVFADKFQGDPLDCIGGALNDLMADSKGGVYFTMGGLFYTDPNGVVAKYGEKLQTNGIILSPDEKTLYVTNAGALAAFDVQKDGSLTNQREFAKFQPPMGGDGSTIDSTGRIYVTTNPGVQVIGSDGKWLGLIPTPRNVISVAFSGPDKRTLYAVVQYRDEQNAQHGEILTIRTIAQGYKGRAK